jgi:predicted nucleotide-binding protein (sugar kinase/HSP70/actin superfamily)
VALDLSSFKCGHDAPVYNVVQNIIEMSGTPYFAFKDIDENRPASSIRIRVETIAYFLRRYHDQVRMTLQALENQLHETLETGHHSGLQVHE